MHLFNRTQAMKQGNLCRSTQSYLCQKRKIVMMIILKIFLYDRLNFTSQRTILSTRPRRSGNPLPPDAQKYGDLGYQGWQKESSSVNLPHKKPKNGTLTDQQKKENKEHSKIRIAVEHQFSRLKKFRILGEVYRNFRKKHNLRFNIIAGIINLQLGF